MPIRVECHACHATFQAGDASAGKRGRCPKCQAVIVVPTPTHSSESHAASDEMAAEPHHSKPEHSRGSAEPAESIDTYAVADERSGPRYQPARRTAEQSPAAAGPRSTPKSSSQPTRAGRFQVPEQTSPTQTPAQILAAFRGEIEAIRPSPLYRVWILVVTAMMLLLPLIYLGIVALACYGMFWHATHNVVIFRNVRNARAALFLYAAPLAIFAVLVFFLFKPLFAPPARRPKRKSLDPSREPLLFAFVDGICAAVGAPSPVRIDVDCQVNASASAERGFFSLLRRRLVLTVGLPLVATLELRQFAGVLAHEFGHFSQSAGMSLTFLIGSINAWFARVVYQRDEWDVTLDEWSRDGHFAVLIVANLARLVVWLTRRILWVLMMAGHAISCMMLRQMEFNADLYETQLVGSSVAESTFKRLPVVMMAERGAFADLSENWKEGKLADNLPHLIAANIPQLPQQILDSVDSMLAQGKTGMFDTHPSDKDRIAAVLRENAAWDLSSGRAGHRSVSEFRGPLAIHDDRLLQGHVRSGNCSRAAPTRR